MECKSECRVWVLFCFIQSPRGKHLHSRKDGGTPTDLCLDCTFWTTQPHRLGRCHGHHFPLCLLQKTSGYFLLQPTLHSVNRESSFTLSAYTKPKTLCVAFVSCSFYVRVCSGASQPVFKFSVVQGRFLYLPKPHSPKNRHNGSTDAGGPHWEFLRSRLSEDVWTVPLQRELLVNTGCGDCHRHPALPAAQALLLLNHPDTSVPK